jgi:hypothetical protein
MNDSDISIDLNIVPENTPLYMMMTAEVSGWSNDWSLPYSTETINAVILYLETGVIDILALFDDDHDSQISELVDAMCYLLALVKPDHFCAEYWLATLTDNWILEQQNNGNSPTDNKWLIDVTDMIYASYTYPLTVNNPDYVIAGSYPLSLINPRVDPNDIDIFYVGSRNDLGACDDLFTQIRGQYNNIRSSSYPVEHEFLCNDGNSISYSYDNTTTWQLVLEKYPSATHVLTSFVARYV